VTARRVADQLPAWRVMAERLVNQKEVSELEATAHPAGMMNSNEVAEAFSWVHREFLASWRSKFRTPVSVVIGMAAHLVESELNPRQRECVQALKKSGDELRSLIDEMIESADRDRRPTV
jgi:signal transduction histidine kinase